MTPVKPKLNSGERLVTYAKSQPPYIPLMAAVASNGRASTEWRLTWLERFKLVLGGRVKLEILTFNEPLQPVKLSVTF